MGLELNREIRQLVLDIVVKWSRKKLQILEGGMNCEIHQTITIFVKRLQKIPTLVE